MPQTTRLEGKPHQCGRLLNLCRVYLLSCCTPECPDIVYFLLTRSDGHGVISIVNRSERYSRPVGCPKDRDHLGLHCHRAGGFVSLWTRPRTWTSEWNSSGSSFLMRIEKNSSARSKMHPVQRLRSSLLVKISKEQEAATEGCWSGEWYSYICTVKGHLGFCIGTRLEERGRNRCSQSSCFVPFAYLELLPCGLGGICWRAKWNSERPACLWTLGTVLILEPVFLLLVAKSILLDKATGRM